MKNLFVFIFGSEVAFEFTLSKANVTEEIRSSQKMLDTIKKLKK